MIPCEEIAACLGIDPETVFWFDRDSRRPVIAVWMKGWTDSDLARRGKLKSEVKAIADLYGAKIYMSELHPHERERRELKKRKRLGKGAAKFWRENEWKRQKGLCMWCNEPVPKKHATLEHIVPVSEGGSLEPPNLGMACAPCNSNRYKMSEIVTFWKLFKFRLRMTSSFAGLCR